MFFKFFKNKDQEENSSQPDETLASITYLVKRGSPSVIIDIEMNDYDEESSLAMCNIIDILSEDFSYAETIHIIQTALLNDKQEDLILKIFTHISEHSRDKILKTNHDSKKDEPCIKPSDML